MIIMMLIQIYQQLERLPVKPPVTIALLGANIAPYLLPNANVLGYYLDDVSANCLHPQKIVNSFLYRGEIQWNRVLLSGFMHAHDQHLYYNMLSLCWKGINLETTLGSDVFLMIAVYSLVVSHILVVLTSYCLVEYGNYNHYSAEYSTCMVGYSAVLFAFKYILNSLPSSPTSQVLGGMAVPAKYAAWLELVLIYFMVPNSSFMGHLCGIFAGMLYVHVFGNYLSKIVRSITRPAVLSGAAAAAGHGYGHGNNNSYSNTRYTYAGGRVGWANDSEKWER